MKTKQIRDEAAREGARHGDNASHACREEGVLFWFQRAQLSTAVYPIWKTAFVRAWDKAFRTKVSARHGSHGKTLR